MYVYMYICVCVCVCVFVCVSLSISLSLSCTTDTYLAGAGEAGREQGVFCKLCTEGVGLSLSLSHAQLTHT